MSGWKRGLFLAGLVTWLACAVAVAKELPAVQQVHTVNDAPVRSAFVQSSVKEAPKLVSTMLAALFVAWLGWRVTSGVTARWDLQKKRAELDITLAKEFYKVIGDFKSIARGWQALGTRPQPASAMATWKDQYTALVSRAIAAESDVEAILLKLASEFSGEEEQTPHEREQRLHSAGLLRAAFRNLREAIEEKRADLPGYGDAEFWLFNRVAGEISKIVFARAARTPRRPDAPPPGQGAKEYLQMLSYRTSDLQAAAAHLIPGLIQYFDARDRLRFDARIENIGRLFLPACWEIVEPWATADRSLQPSTVLVITQARHPVQTQWQILTSNGPRSMVRQDWRSVTEAAWRSMAPRLFARYGAINHCLLFADDPSRVIVMDRQGAVHSYMPSQVLPKELPLQDTTRLYAATLLAWELQGVALDALKQVATVPIL